MGLHREETIPHLELRREKYQWQWISRSRNIEELKMLREVGIKMRIDAHHLKTDMQTVVKMSCDPNNMECTSSESKSMKEDRILDSLDLDCEREKGDLSKEDVCSLSLEWQLRAVDLYRNSVHNKTEESVLETEDKSLAVFPFSKKYVEKSDGVKENPGAENMKRNTTKNEEHKTDSNKNASTKDNSAVYMYKLEKEKFIDQSEKSRDQEVHILSVKDNKFKENMKISDRKKRQEEQNMKMKQNLTPEIKLKLKMINSENERFINKIAKNNKNEKQKKDEVNTALAVNKKVSLTADPIDQQKQNYHWEQQKAEKQDMIEKLELELPMKKSAEQHMIQTSIDETDKEQTYLPTLLRYIIQHISKDEQLTEEQRVQEGHTNLGIERRDITESKQTENETADIHFEEKQQKDEWFVKTKKDSEVEHTDSDPVVHIEVRVHEPMIDLHAAKYKSRSCAGTVKGTRGGGGPRGGRNGAQGQNGGGSNGSGGGGSNGPPSGSSSGGSNGGSSNGGDDGGGNGRGDKPENTFEHKDQPGDTDNPDRDKEALDSNGAAGPDEPRGVHHVTSGTGHPPGGAAATIHNRRGYVQSTVAQFSPPRTPPWSPTAHRVQAVRGGRGTSQSPPAVRRSSWGNSGLGAVRHGTLEALQGYDIYSAVGLLVSKEDDDKQFVNIVLEQFNTCLPRCIRPNHGGSSDGCTICSLLSSLLKHTGRCVLSRNKDGCGRCMQVDAILHYHVEKCMRNAGCDEYSQGEAANGGPVSGPAQYRAMNGVCKIPLCRKIREKLKVQKAGRESRDLSEIWRTPKLWEAIRDYLGKVFSPHFDENREMALSICLESIGAPAWSDIPTRFSSLVTSRAASDAVRRLSGASGPRSNRGDVAVGVGGDLMLLSVTSSTSDQAELPATAQAATSSRSGSRGSDSHSISDFVEGGPFSEYMTQGPWHLQDVLESAAGAGGGAAAAAGGGGMQPQGLGQRSPEVIHHLNGSGSDQLPTALFQTTFTSFQPCPAPLDLAEEIYAPDSLPVFPVESEGQPRVTLGQGHVAYGDRRHLMEIAGYWEELRAQFKNDEIKLDKKFWEGIILAEYMGTLCIEDGEYSKHAQWERAVFLGSGMSGKTYLAIDGRTGHFFCVKKVPLLKFQPEEITIWSQLTHPNIVKLYGVLRRGQKIYFLEEFLDGPSLQQHIETCQRLNNNMSLQYFRQILQALVYLQQKYVLHEDIKADNILLRAQSMDLVLVDFGLSRQLPPDNPFVSAGENPVGGSTQWSPEKAASEGHSFPAEVWAACCVLLHMLTGTPPWVKRYPAAGALHFIIKIQAPPIEEVPVDLDARLKDLFKRCWSRDVSQRWTAQQLLGHSAFQILDEKRTPRGRIASLTEPQVSSVNVAANQKRHFPLSNHNGSSTAARMPAYKLKEQDDTSLAEIAMSLASEMDEYLASTDQGGLTNRRAASVRDEERIETPVKVKKSKAKSPTRAEKQPLTIPRQIMRTISNESNKSFELDMGVLQAAGFLDSNADPLDDVFHSEIKEPDFDILKSFDDVTSHLPFHVTTESPKYNVSRSQLPALSIFESSSSSRSERSSSTRDSRTTSGVPANQQPISDQLTKVTPCGHPVTGTGDTAVPMAPSSTNHLPALSIFNTMASSSHRSREEQPASSPQKTATGQPAQQSPRQSRRAEQKETTESSQTAKMSPRPARVITGRQGVSNRNGEVPFSVTGDAQPSGRTTISSIEPFHVQERRRILDFEDLYTAPKEGQMVGIGAKSKVSTFASPALVTSEQKRNTEDKPASKTDAKQKQRSGLILVPVTTTTSQETNIALVSPVEEPDPGMPRASPLTKKISSSNQRTAPPANESPPYEPVIAVANYTAASTRPRNTSQQTNHSEVRNPAVTSTANIVQPRTTATPTPRNNNSNDPIYEAVICRRALEPQPEPQEPEVQEPTHVLPPHERIRKITPPSPITEEASETGSDEGQGHRAQSKGHSPVVPRDKGMLDPSIPIGRSLSEPAYFQNGRPLSPWERQSSSNSQEVEQEYRSLIDEFYQDQWSKSSETSFGGFGSLPHIQDDDSPEAEPVVVTSEETVVSQDEYDHAATSIDWLNYGYINSTVTGVKVSFCDDGMNELCSVRVHDTRQRWHEVIMRISSHPTVIQSSISS